MKKKIIIGLVITFSLLLAAAIALPFVFKDKIVGLIKEEANKNLNAKLNFSDFDLSLIKNFPDFSLQLNDLSIIGIDEFNNDTLLYSKQLTVSLNLMSVIKGDQIQIKTIMIDQALMKAIVLENGKANWDITKPDDTVQTSDNQEPSKFKASLKSYEIKNSTVIYDDREGKMYAELKGFNHSGSGDFTQDLFELKTYSTVEKLSYADAGVKLLKEVKSTLKMDLDMNMPEFKFTFKDNELKMNDLFLTFNGFMAMPNDDIDMDISFNAPKTDFKNLLSLIPGAYTKDFEQVKTSGKLSLKGHAKGKYSDKSMPGFGIKLLVENAYFQYPSLPKAVKNINMDLSIDNKDGIIDNTIIDLKKLHIEMAENPIDMHVLVRNPESDPNMKGAIIGKLLLGSIKEFIPLEADQKLQGSISSNINFEGNLSTIEKGAYDQFLFAGNMEIADLLFQSKETPYGIKINKMLLNFSPQFVELATFDALLGKSDINAQGKINNIIQYVFKDELLQGQMNINSKLLNLNEFMTSTETQSTTNNQTSSEMGVIEIPANIDFTLQSNINTLLYDKLEIKEVLGVLKVKEQKVLMENLKMNLMDGILALSGSYETKNIKMPSVDFGLQISNFDIQKTAVGFNTVEKLAPIAKKCNGKFSSTLSFKASLDEKMQPVLNSLSGSGSLSTAQVSISNFEPINKIADAIKMEKYKQLDLKNIKLAFSFKDGRINTEPFDVKIASSTANISGSTGFDQSIDYIWKLDIPSSEFGSGANAAIGSLLSKIPGGNIAVPQRIKLNLNITGQVSSPKVKVDLLQTEGNNLADDMKNKAKEELEKRKAELEAKARNEADKMKKQAEEKARAEAEKLKQQAEKAKEEAQNKAKAEAERLKKEAESKVKDEAKKKLKGLLKP